MSSVVAFLSFLLLFSFFVKAVDPVKNRWGGDREGWTKEPAEEQSRQQNTQRLATNSSPLP